MHDKSQPRTAATLRLSSLVSRLLRCASGLALVIALPAAATSYVPMTDRALADRADAVALISVDSITPGPDREAISTDYLVRVERVLEGDIGGSAVVVRVPGGLRADGVGLKIWGAPDLVPGERALVFLVANRDGSFGLEGLMLGAFHLAPAGRGLTLALRDLSEAHAVVADPDDAEAEPLRDAERFADWIADRGLGIERRPDYVVAASRDLLSAQAKFARMTAADGKSPRWFRFDGGQDTAWYDHRSGQPGLSSEATGAAFRSALEAWTSDPTSQILYSYGGTTGATGGFRGADRMNTILFDDPYGDVSGRFDCAAGGVLALGGPYFYNSLRADQHEIFEADIVMQDGTQCFFQDNPTGAAEVFAHELGHTLGFNHSAERDAVMYGHAKNDGRGSRLGQDDRIAASALYGDGSYQGEAPTPGTPPVTGTAGTIQLKAKPAARTSVRLDWKSLGSKPMNYEVGIVKADGSFQRLASAKKTARSLMVKGLKPNTAYAFRVRGLLPGTAGVDSNLVTVQTKK